VIQVPCDIRGPYFPVGQIDWTCRTHHVTAHVRPDVAKRIDGNYTRDEFFCPVAEPQYLEGIGNRQKVTLDGATAAAIACWIDANVSVDETDDGVVAKWLNSLAPDMYPDTSVHDRLVKQLALDLMQTTDQTTPENYARFVLTSVLNAIDNDCNHDNDTRDSRDVVDYKDIHVLLTGRLPNT
jgi:hypothetical protein